MKIKKISLIVAVVGVLAVSALAFADILMPTLTKVYFKIDGEPSNKSFEYTVNCYGHSWAPGEDPIEVTEADLKGPDAMDKVYSYSAVCPSYGCSIYENYYLNYRNIGYCSLRARANSGEEYYVENFGDKPYGECESVESELTDDQDRNIERVCTTEFALFSKKPDAFSDVTQTHRYYDAVWFAKVNGIVSGYLDGTFRPDDRINRAEFTKIIMLAAPGYESKLASCVFEREFPDVNKTEWYAPYICTAYNEGIISGYLDGTFKPGAEINFAEAAKIVSEAYGLIGGEAGESWYDIFVDNLEIKNAVPETVNDPGKYINRGEMADIIYSLREQE